MVPILLQASLISAASYYLDQTVVPILLQSSLISATRYYQYLDPDCGSLIVTGKSNICYLVLPVPGPRLWFPYCYRQVCGSQNNTLQVSLISALRP